MKKKFGLSVVRAGEAEAALLALWRLLDNATDSGCDVRALGNKLQRPESQAYLTKANAHLGRGGTYNADFQMMSATQDWIKSGKIHGAKPPDVIKRLRLLRVNIMAHGLITTAEIQPLPFVELRRLAIGVCALGAAVVRVATVSMQEEVELQRHQRVVLSYVRAFLEPPSGMTP